MQLKQFFLYLLSGFFFIAGINHFVHPDFYLPLIPEYLGYPEIINYRSGVAEVLLGIGLLFAYTRKVSAYLIIALLIAFIPSHVYFIRIGSCVPDGLCVHEWVAWVRLLIIHPLFMVWAWCVKG
ncbi:MauE/DoxX family redox-associated membrane protein [uncultured Aquimarina sp.]|uniref:DoxX family protein n=1 Tax=uncultured Aquimarina sp. TaxID=575652 RepID=UPI0026362544|nr:MauE/DoxX family redox-associated membrane protein [uncultured Aquimarina sp.]